MDITSFPLLSPLLSLAYDGLMVVTALVTPIAGAAAPAVAVALVTLLVRTALLPLGVATARAEQARARLAPRLRDLQRRYRRDPERLQRETMALYRAHGTSPFAGCLPVLAQAPVLGLLYAVFVHATIGGRPNELLGETLLGVPLGSSLVAEIASGAADGATWLVFGVIIAVIAGVAEATRRLLPVTMPGAPEGTEGARDRSAPHTPQIPQIPVAALGALQFATTVIAVFVPLAAAIYLVVTVAWTLAQRLILRRRYPLEEASS